MKSCQPIMILPIGRRRRYCSRTMRSPASASVYSAAASGSVPRYSFNAAATSRPNARALSAVTAPPAALA